MANSNKRHRKVMLWANFSKFSSNSRVGKKNVSCSPSFVTYRQCACGVSASVKTCKSTKTHYFTVDASSNTGNCHTHDTKFRVLTANRSKRFDINSSARLCAYG
jgi:hypothetical protein